jgi:hypothetical protein
MNGARQSMGGWPTMRAVLECGCPVLALLGRVFGPAVECRLWDCWNRFDPEARAECVRTPTQAELGWGTPVFDSMKIIGVTVVRATRLGAQRAQDPAYGDTQLNGLWNTDAPSKEYLLTAICGTDPQAFCRK